MTVKTDIQRAINISKSEEFAAITSMPSYQAELARTANDYQGRSWIELKGLLPKFSTDEFEARRTAYQAKYGNKVQVPGFNDVIHVLPATKITTEEMAAHRWAQKRGLESPLATDQLQLLATKKHRFLTMLASPMPTWLRTYGAVATSMDNIEDALVTLYWTGRLVVAIAPRLLGKAVPVLGWALIGSDILNMANVAVWVGALRRGCKALHGQIIKGNPFSTEAKAAQAIRLKQRTPGFGAFLEFLQTTDQLFGVGLCLGGLVGLVHQASMRAMDLSYWKELGGVLTTGNPNDAYMWITKSVIWDVYSVKLALEKQFDSLASEANRLKIVDEKLRENVLEWTKKKANETWEWIKTQPESVTNYYSDPLIASMILSSGMQDFAKDQHTKGFLFLNQAIQGLMPWWYENDPIKNMKEIMNLKWPAPEPKEPDTIALLEESIHDWKDTIRWPHIEQKYATFEEIGYAYAPKVKESFQTYCLNYRHEYTAMAAASECTEFVKNVIRSYDDNHEVRVSMTAHAAAAVDMIDQGHIIDPNTDQNLIDQLSDYIGECERKTTEPPKIKDIVRKGTELGIKWIASPPKEVPAKVEELFPGWHAMQDQIGELYIAN